MNVPPIRKSKAPMLRPQWEDIRAEVKRFVPPLISIHDPQRSLVLMPTRMMVAYIADLLDMGHSVEDLCNGPLTIGGVRIQATTRLHGNDFSIWWT
jgi:hypothetical protein